MKRLIRVLALSVLLCLAVAVPAAGEKKEAAKNEAPDKTALEKTYWFTIKSGIRHNSRCRYFQTRRADQARRMKGEAARFAADIFILGYYRRTIADADIPISEIVCARSRYLR